MPNPAYVKVQKTYTDCSHGAVGGGRSYMMQVPGRTVAYMLSGSCAEIRGRITQKRIGSFINIVP